MSLHSGIDTVAFSSLGTYSETYGSGGQKYINNLYASYGMLEDAPGGVPVVGWGIWMMEDPYHEGPGWEGPPWEHIK